MRIIDLRNQKFGRWTVLDRFAKKSPKVYWLCRCDCCTEKPVRQDHLRKGVSTSCGCYLAEWCSETKSTHRLSGTRQYLVWSAIKDRCFNPKNPAYKNYGARGITICDEWRDNFQAFFDYVGLPPSPGLTVDRTNNDGNYEPGNIRWATRLQQRHNRRH